MTISDVLCFIVIGFAFMGSRWAGGGAIIGFAVAKGIELGVLA